MKLKVEYVPIDDVKPYEGNAKLHPAEQIEQIKKSIEEFGFLDPIAIWQDGKVIEGHGRLIAAHELGMKTVPVIRLDSLTDEQRRAYTLVHNKLTMNSGFNMDLLSMELEMIDDIDMDAFGFDIEDFDLESLHEEYQEETQERVEDIVNLRKGQYAGEGRYDIPKLAPVYELPEIKEWIGFNYVLSDKDPTGKAVHFFIDDYQFERLWNDPDKYIDKLKQYVCVATPDFSPYGDMPMALQIYNHYRKHWCGAYMQERGITVIPTIRRSTDARSREWYLEGEPQGGIVLISSMWSRSAGVRDVFLNEYEYMKDVLNPKKVLIYGDKVAGIAGNIEYIPSFSMKRWKNDKKEG